MNIRILAVCAAALSLAAPAVARPSSPATQGSPASTATTPGHHALPAPSLYCAVASPPNTGSPPYHHNFHGSCAVAGDAAVGAPCNCPPPADGYPGVVKAGP